MRAFSDLGVWRWVVGNVFLFKMSFGWNFSDNPCESYALVNLQLTFSAVQIRKLLHLDDFLSQALRIMIKHWSNDVCGFKMRYWPKIWTFWLSNDHFAPAVDCRAIRVFNCAILCCKSWNLAWGCLTMFIGMWDLIGPLENFLFLIRTQTLVLTVWETVGLCNPWGILKHDFDKFFEEYGRANFGVQQHASWV